MPIDKTYLERHGNQWRVIVRVPPSVRHVIGKANLKASLGTANLGTANLLKHQHVDRFKRLIEDALRASKVGGGEGTIYDEARLLRAAIAREEVSKADLSAVMDERFYAVAKSQGDAHAESFAHVSLGQATPIREYLNDFIEDWGYQPKTLVDLKKAITRIEEWLPANGHKQTVEAVTEDGARAFIKGMLDEGLSRKHVAKTVSFLRSYWEWMEEHKRVTKASRPWAVKLPKARTKGRYDNAEPDRGKRPYTDEELLKLLSGTPNPRSSYLSDLIPIAALSGMRLEEIYRLRVRDCREGYFDILTGKTENATRQVPIHTGLRHIMHRLLRNRTEEEFLLDPEAPVIELTGIRSARASKAFTRYRRDLGMDERPNEKAQSNIDFHSLRRWFIKSARDALTAGAKGYTAWTIADVVGHDDEGMKDVLTLTMSHYPGPSGDAARKACVAAVKLPSRATVGTP